MEEEKLKAAQAQRNQQANGVTFAREKSLHNEYQGFGSAELNRVSPNMGVLPNTNSNFATTTVATGSGDIKVFDPKSDAPSPRPRNLPVKVAAKITSKPVSDPVPEFNLGASTSSVKPLLGLQSNHLYNSSDLRGSTQLTPNRPQVQKSDPNSLFPLGPSGPELNSATNKKGVVARASVALNQPHAENDYLQMMSLNSPKNALEPFSPGKERGKDSKGAVNKDFMNLELQGAAVGKDNLTRLAPNATGQEAALGFGDSPKLNMNRDIHKPTANEKPPQSRPLLPANAFEIIPSVITDIHLPANKKEPVVFEIPDEEPRGKAGGGLIIPMRMPSANSPFLPKDSKKSAPVTVTGQQGKKF